MKHEINNPIIKAALRTIEEETAKEEENHAKNFGDKRDLWQENMEHRKYIDILEQKQQQWLKDEYYIESMERKLDGINDAHKEECWELQRDYEDALDDCKAEIRQLRRTASEDREQHQQSSTTIRLLEEDLNFVRDTSRTDRIKLRVYKERLNEFDIIVHETDAYWRKKDLRAKAYIEYLRAPLGSINQAMRHEEAILENARRDGCEIQEH